jgi:(p)ppGpp synthase/HD superfamily hydrolase
MNYSNSTDEMVCAAYLHDVLEDCKHISKEDIQKEFGDLITYYIYKLTNISKLLGIYPRKARKEYDRNRLSDAPKEVKIIKMFDRIDNLSDMNCFEKGFVRLYIEESELLLEKIGNADENIAKELKDIILKEKSKL